MTAWPPGRWHAEALRPLTGRGVRVVVIDNGGKRAWSNPIWWDEIG